jgi:hypothetical protein
MMNSNSFPQKLTLSHAEDCYLAAITVILANF